MSDEYRRGIEAAAWIVQGALDYWADHYGPEATTERVVDHLGEVIGDIRALTPTPPEPQPGPLPGNTVQMAREIVDAYGDLKPQEMDRPARQQLAYARRVLAETPPAPRPAVDVDAMRSQVDAREAGGNFSDVFATRKVRALLDVYEAARAWKVAHENAHRDWNEHHARLCDLLAALRKAGNGNG